ncbi:hypothetical protein D5F01_LYC03362 [Larimichthys crocea]|uniref:Ig-like domain-containing protein n=1 Tax=Larimichthys crocea TaxID=215358 RepID=A0A6G0J5N1_LARCR|nr:hypothetical protein D5F01_LYC03362 [Larimichthys crocea]
MVHPQRTCSHMELLPLVCLCLLSCSGTTSADPAGTVVVEKGSDVILPCSNNGVNLETESFDWTKGQMKVFSYAVGQHSNKGKTGQAEQFRGRVSHFEEELKHGNASIKITNATMADSGDYTCDFPGVHPARKSDVKLVVGAAPEPCVKTVFQTETLAVLQCKAHGVPDLEVHWQDSDGNKLPAEEPQVTERGGLSYITLKTTVTKTDNFSCVATQKNISHRISSEINIKIDEPDNTGWIVAVVFIILFVAYGAVVGVVLYKRIQKHKRDMKQLKDGATEKLSDGARP